ncbi:MAG TPA: FliA/WhiG family RNA polymerase sigma factor [Terriglobia bacterium]|nr:FliA/WhiG family RNA polymerase sigma factor [Terriglobia bacterium]
MPAYGDVAVQKTQSAPNVRRAASRTKSGARPHVAGSSRSRSLRAPAAAAGSCVDRDELALALLPLVKRVAFEMRERLPQHVEVEDLAGAGVLGLLDAVRKFDARKHVRIETYARHRIRGAILDSLREMDTASRDMRRKNKNAEKVYRELEARLGRAVSDEEMAQALGISLKKWYRAVSELNSMGVEWMRPGQIPEVPLVDEGNIAADDQEDAFESCYRREQHEMLAYAMAQLAERERAVLNQYYREEMTMKQIGDVMGIDESRVSQIHSAAVSHLRAKVRKLLQTPSNGMPPAYMIPASAVPQMTA